MDEFGNLWKGIRTKHWVNTFRMIFLMAIEITWNVYVFVCLTVTWMNDHMKIFTIIARVCEIKWTNKYTLLYTYLCRTPFQLAKSIENNINLIIRSTFIVSFWTSEECFCIHMHWRNGVFGSNFLQYSCSTYITWEYKG